ncbi:MAG: hypothetical protein IJU77_04320 [Butyrivibrio sp.]|jgi:hypothetical protein|nr:hypothetical protein [Butyrivibrio sp.]
MKMLLHILKIIAIIGVVFFGVTFTVYIFNLDMKLTAAIFPWLDKQYDKVKRDQHLYKPED